MPAGRCKDRAVSRTTGRTLGRTLGRTIKFVSKDAFMTNQQKPEVQTQHMCSHGHTVKRILDSSLCTAYIARAQDTVPGHCNILSC